MCETFDQDCIFDMCFYVFMFNLYTYEYTSIINRNTYRYCNKKWVTNSKVKPI